MIKKELELFQRKIIVTDNLPIDLPPLLKRIYLQRGISYSSCLDRSTEYLLSFTKLSGINKAVTLIYKMLINNRKITIIGDFDTDGATGTALTVLALRSMGGKNIKYLIPNRFENGYGLTPEVVEQVRLEGTDMIITVDNGISSHVGIQCARKYGIPVLITDHHLPGNTLPNADVIINPNITKKPLPLTSLSGVGVVFYLMIALRNYLRDKGWFNQSLIEPNLADLLDLVALGTVADVVPLNFNNRILVWQGLIRIRAGKCRPGIRALLEITNCDITHLVTNDLSFSLGPRLNAAGRLDNMSIGVALLLTEDLKQARLLANELNCLNQKRKKIENNMQIKALKLSNLLTCKTKKIPLGLVFYHPTWHEGIVGILASRLKERFYRPVIAFAPSKQGLLKGSGRSILDIHLRNVLEKLNSAYPGLIIKFGGHSMAVGLELKEENYKMFRYCFCELIHNILKNKKVKNVIWSDGSLNSSEISMQTAIMLRNAGPWGQDFPEPSFDGKFKLINQRLVGDRHLQVILKFLDEGPVIEGIAFNVNTNLWPNLNIKIVKLVYKLDIKFYRGKRSIQLIIEHLWPID
ncbi:MAG: single-stranded-DNA-specific exonuclease RecJ [Pantoea sp. Brub]|nr:single-stranded-DNA-specific exonuclease RecJ [Pantoea sp. Brub]